jgi:hypothetical protein
MIRAGFLQKLRKYLPTGHYSARWNMVPLLSAVDPDESNVQMVRERLHSSPTSQLTRPIAPGAYHHEKPRKADGW